NGARRRRTSHSCKPHPEFPYRESRRVRGALPWRSPSAPLLRFCSDRRVRALPRKERKALVIQELSSCQTSRMTADSQPLHSMLLPLRTVADLSFFEAKHKPLSRISRWLVRGSTKSVWARVAKNCYTLLALKRR